MRVLISGAGIAGPVAAAALGRAGIDAVVHEAHASPAEHLGSFLSLAPNGLAVLRTLDLLDPVLDAALARSTAIEFRNGRGRPLGRLSDGSHDLAPGLQSVSVMRGTLQARLAGAAAAQGAEIVYGKRLTACRTTGSGVVAEFSDGTTAEGDVLLGADGLHSPVRTDVDPAAPRPAYTGLLNVGGLAEGAAVAPTPPETTRMVYGRRAFFGHQTDDRGRTFWFVNAPHAEVGRREAEALGPGHWRPLVTGLFRDDLPEITAILDASPDEHFLPLGVYDIASLPRWCDGPIGLIGDAAHAVSSSSGQGASLAMEDAVTVARCLRDIPDPARALATYESLRRRRVERIVAEGRKRGNSKLATGAVQAFVRDAFMSVVIPMIAKRKGHSWIFDHRIDFDEPVAPAAA
nr:FAD-dependent monooxygenase [Nocardiopsis chromatogenes]